MEKQTKIEWINSFESCLAEALSSGEPFKQWVFGICDKQTGDIHIFIDNILKAYNVTGFKPFEQWFTVQCTKHLTHELIHYLAPELSEAQTEKATERFIRVWLERVNR